MKTFQKALMAALLLLGFLPRAHAAEIFKNDDLDFNLGGRIQVVGDAELVTDDPVRDHMRLFLWDESDRLFTTGNYQGYKWDFEVEFGGETPGTSNGTLNLFDANVDIPLIPDMATLKVGQFKVPGNLESADYEGNLLFTEKSPIFNLFFNQGYDTGVALYGHIGNLDGQAGLVQGGPDLPQRYLPEVLNFPTPFFVRIGYDEIQDDPFHPKQTGFDKPKNSQFAFHLTGYYSADQNAGHSEDFGLGGGYLSTFNANNVLYGNVLNSSVFNPYETVAGVAPVTADLWQFGFDFQYRTPLADTMLTLQGQAMAAGYNMTVPLGVPYETAPAVLPGDKSVLSGTLSSLPGTQYNINIGGAEIMASVGDKPWEIAGRFDMVIPDINELGTYVQRNTNGSQTTTTPVTVITQNPVTTAGPVTVGYATPVTTIKAGTAITYYAPVFTNSDPIYEVTFPSITYHFNNDCKLIAETLFMFNTPAVQSDDGTYLIAEMPGSADSGIGQAPLGPANGANFRIGFVPMGRMMFQMQF